MTRLSANKAINMHFASFIIIPLLFCHIISAELPDISQLNINDLQQLPELANTNLTVDDAKNLLREKCIDVAGEVEGTKAFEEIEAGTGILMECINGVVNYTAVGQEIEDAKPRGELDVVFNKYCSKRNDAMDCIKNFNAKLVPCLDADERQNQDVFMRIMNSLLNFVCHKGGDQIALFIAEKGPECLTAKKTQMEQCVNNTFHNYMPKDGGLEGLKHKKLPKFVITPEQCGQLDQVETCIVKHLEDCEDITPANIVESMFRFIRNETVCRNVATIAEKQSITSKQSNSYLNIMLFGATLIFTLFISKFM